MNAPVTKEAEPTLIGQRDLPEMTAVHMRDPVVLREPLVDERVIRRQQLADAAVLPHLTLDEQLGFLTQRLTEILIKIRKQLGVRRNPSFLVGSYDEATEILAAP